MNFTHRRWALHVLTWLFVVGVVASSSPAAQGSEPNVAVVVDCPLVSSEGKAAVEARARAELMVNGLDNGMLVVVCTVDGATVRWRPGPGAPVAESGPVVEGVELVEQLVDLVHRVAARAVQPAEPEADAGANAGAAAAPDGDTAAAADADAETTKATEPAEAKRQNPVAEPVEDLEREADESGAAARERVAPYPEEGFVLLLGMSGQLWQGDIPGAVGFRFGWGLRPSRSTMGVVVVGGHWGVTQSDWVTAESFDLSFEFDFRLLDGWYAGSDVDGWWLGTGLCLSEISTNAGSHQIDRGGTNAPAVGMLVRWRYGLRWRSLRFFVGPGLQILDHTQKVAIDGRDAFSVPWYVATLTVEAQALYR